MNNQENENREKNQDKSSEDISNFSNFDLLKNASSLLSSLLHQEVDLAKSEIKADMQNSTVFAIWVGIACFLGLLTFMMLLVSLVFALSPYISGWLAALIIAGLFLILALISFTIAWTRRIQDPFSRIKETLNLLFRSTKRSKHAPA